MSSPSTPPVAVPPMAAAHGASPQQMTQLAERLHAQQALAAKRESVAAELRQLAESYKAKSERLGQQLVEEREKAAAQGELWKQQLHALRTRSRADRERLRSLEEGMASQSPCAGSEAWATRTPGAGGTSTPGGGGIRSSVPRSGGSSMPRSGGSSVSATPPANGGLRRGVERVRSTASSIDAKVDRALDRVDGLVGRIASSRGATTTKAGTFSPLSTAGD